MNNPKRILVYIGIGLITQVLFGRADYLVAIRIQDFTTTCDDCGTYFQYCIQSLSSAEQNCLESHQHVQPGVLLDFSQEYLLLRENPLIFRGQTKEWEGASIYLAAFDRNTLWRNTPLIEARINLTFASTQLGQETVNTTFTGPMGHSNLTASFLVRCAEYWYGDDCYTWCQFNCMCDLPVPCHNNCVGVVCGENRHCVDGVDVYVCTCDEGFTGRQCEININECAGVNCSGNGRCIDRVASFHCDCDSGYSGALCETTTVRENTLPYLIAAIIGWILLITLALIVIVGVMVTKLKDRHSQHKGNAITVQSDSLVTSFVNERTQENISYRAIPPATKTTIAVHMPAKLATTAKVNIGYNERDDSEYYENSSEVLYEDIS